MKFDRMRSFGLVASHLCAHGAILVAALATAAPASAGDEVGVLDCRTPSGQSVVGVRPGQTFVARVSLSSDLPLVYNSAIFRLVLTREGVSIDDYAWTQPFETGGPTDFSLIGVELPSVIDSETLAGPTYPKGVIDAEFANFLIEGDAGTGTVVEVELTMPAKAQPGESFFVVAVPDTFAFGFIPYPIAAGSVLTARATFSPDFDDDGIVGGADLAIYLARWGTPEGDLTGDGQSNSEDLALLLGNWS
ncbi:MAG: hypothetical protein GC172_14425 [Phycisphaera sp.]|nr:hypothetical protein [Phycisphaera sp.]